jgi:ATP-dependent Lhr-like helicase
MGGAVELLHPKLRGALPELGYSKLLPVQEKAIPAILSKHHTLIIAPTGSGKTEAAILPVLSMMLSEAGEGGLGGGVKVVYVTPLRALNRDVAERIEKLSSSVGFKTLVRHGDTGPAGRRRFLEEPPDIVVTTPESLSLLLTLKDRLKVWSNVGWVIVDEVHEMLESERGSELAVVLERLQLASKRRIQRIGLSATLSEKSVKMALELLAHGRYAVVVEDPESKVYDVNVEVVYSGDEKFWDEAVRRIAGILESTSSALVFVNTRYTAELLASNLSRVLGEGNVVAHHGSLSRHVRERAERDFKEGRVKALVATSSMELGVDIGRVGLVVQFLSPRQAIVMTQRAGRAGHRLWEVSRGVIVTVGNLYEMMESGVIAFRAEKGFIEDVEPHIKPYDALAHQLVAMVVEGSVKSVEEAYGILTSTLPYSNLSMEELSRVVKHLANVGVLRESNGKLSKFRRTLEYLYTVTMIPDEREYDVINIVDGRKIGKVSERFVEWNIARKSEEGAQDRFRIVLAGRVWEVLEVDLEAERITVKPIALVEGHIPVWEGELIPVSYRVAREVCSILGLLMEDPGRGSMLLEARKLGAHADYISRIALETKSLWSAAISHVNPVIEDYGRLSILHVCLGTKGNFALSMLLSKLIEKYKAVEFKFIPYAVIFTSPTGVPGELVVRALEEAKSLDPVERASLVYDALRRSKAYLIRFYHVAKRMGVLGSEAKVSYSLVEKLAEVYSGSVVELEALRETLHEKVDLKAVDELLEDVERPVVVKPPKLTPLAEQVLGNPYVRGDVAVNIKAIALDQIIEVKRRYLEGREALMLCTMCGYDYTVKVRDARDKQVCRRCGSSTIAPLPNSEFGKSLVDAYRRYLRGEKISKEEAKLAEEVKDRAGLYLNYASLNLGAYVIKALMTHGVGPRRAKKVLEALVTRGERAFYEELLRAEEEYVATRRYWSSRKAES